MKRKIETGTIIRTAVLGFALANQVLTVTGHSPLPFTDESFGQAASTVLTVASSLWAWWKNNSFTQEAIIADDNMRAQKGK
ncbi:MAG: phage holin [Lachnospiraceae bacterium]|nr:phage holin [Bacteroides fragilis]MCM1219015.1 phage holin [Lachnospiraceae bacterium]